MLLAELRHSLRALRRAPGLTVGAILTVALGVGSGTALFSVVKAVLLNPLPYPQPDRLAWIAESSKSRDRSVSYPDFEDFRRHNRSFSSMAAYSPSTAIVGDNSPEKVQVAQVSGEFFEVMGVRPTFGRTFSRAEQLAPAPPAVIIGYDLWQRVYGGERGILGHPIRLNGYTSTVVGIMPPRFTFPESTEGWVHGPARPKDLVLQLRARETTLADDYRSGLGRAPGQLGRSGLSGSVRFVCAGPGPEDAGRRDSGHSYSARSPVLAPVIRARLRAIDRGAVISFRPMDSVVDNAVARPRFQTQVLAAFAVLALVLAAVGLYGILSYAVSAKRVEIGIRMALGAQPREVFQMVTGRALLLAGIGAALGLAGCIAVRRLLAALLFGIGPSDPSTLASATLTLLIVVLTSSALPAYRASRIAPASALREE
jgi:putative ABC transport system permease protein